MARIKYSALVTEIAGSIGGTTFQRNAYGFTVKNKPNMINPGRSAQKFRQNLFNTNIQKWKSLTNTGRGRWITYASTFPVASKNNVNSQLNGYNYFEKYHNFLTMANAGGLLVNPNGGRGEVLAADIIISRVGATLFAGVADDITITNWWVIFQVTNPVPASQIYVQNTPFRIARYNRQLETDVSIATQYEEKFGRLPEVGETVGVKVIYLNRQAGQWIVFPTQPIVVS